MRPVIPMGRPQHPLKEMQGSDERRPDNRAACPHHDGPAEKGPPGQLGQPWVTGKRRHHISYTRYFYRPQGRGLPPGPPGDILSMLTILLIVLVLFLLFGGGGYYFRGRGRI